MSACSDKIKRLKWISVALASKWNKVSLSWSTESTKTEIKNKIIQNTNIFKKYNYTKSTLQSY